MLNFGLTFAFWRAKEYILSLPTVSATKIRRKCACQGGGPKKLMASGPSIFLGRSPLQAQFRRLPLPSWLDDRECVLDVIATPLFTSILVYVCACLTRARVCGNNSICAIANY